MEGKSLNETFIPKQFIINNKVGNTNTLLEKNEYEQVGGNIYIQINPPQVKICGYEVDKIVSMTIKVINKAPIPQRIHILPPTEGLFSIKCNKKGPIPSGMSQYIQVSFKSNQYKYHYDCIKINTETQNFVVPLYAYPTIPNLNTIFPKIIDFGSVELNQATQFVYPISNPLPVDFEYSFEYIKQCQEIMISPLSAIIPANSIIEIEISFIPTSKKTFTAEVLFILKQFDFEPIHIKIMGSGKDRDPKTVISKKSIRSSKLTPIASTIKQPQQSKKLLINNKKSFNRGSFPKLLANTRKTVVNEEQKTMNIRKIEQKEYLGRFNRVFELDKEKEIKFSQFLGDKPYTLQDIQQQMKIRQEVNKVKMVLISKCIERNEVQYNRNVEVNYSLFQKQVVTFNDNKNDELTIRKIKLDRFQRAATKVILQYRMLKRLGKIKQFLKDCKNKEEVAQKVKQSHLRSLQGIFNNSKKTLDLNFSKSTLASQNFPILYQDNNSQSQQLFKIQGKAQFDDLQLLKPIERDQTDIMRYNLITVPLDFINPPNQYAKARTSAEEQYPLRGPSIGQYNPHQATNVYHLPLKMATHYFLYNNQKIKKYAYYDPIDERDIDYLFEDNSPIEDEFTGWVSGDYQVLKAKFMMNPGCQFLGFQSYAGTGYKYDIGLLQQIDKMMPKAIEGKIQQDMIPQGDSDQEKNPTLLVNDINSWMNNIESKDLKAKQRRNLGKIINQQNLMKQKMDGNLNSIKEEYRVQWVNKTYNFNKWAWDQSKKINI